VTRRGNLNATSKEATCGSCTPRPAFPPPARRGDLDMGDGA